MKRTWYRKKTRKDNIQVVQRTTPAQLFHCLRRQVLRIWRKPLVVMTPKSLLRHPRCVSSLNELAEGSFQRIIPDQSGASPEAVRRVLLCTGKVYYELEKRRQELERDDVAIVRVEQLYPLPRKPLQDALAGYADGTPVIWVQEEPENMGAWRFLRIHFGERLFDRLPFSGVCRQSAASPATGSKSFTASLAFRGTEAKWLRRMFHVPSLRKTLSPSFSEEPVRRLPGACGSPLGQARTKRLPDACAVASG